MHWKYYGLTYRAAVQDIEGRITELVEDINALRDHTSSELQDYPSHCKLSLQRAAVFVSQLDNRITVGHANMVLRSNEMEDSGH